MMLWSLRHQKTCLKFEILRSLLILMQVKRLRQNECCIMLELSKIQERFIMAIQSWITWNKKEIVELQFELLQRVLSGKDIKSILLILLGIQILQEKLNDQFEFQTELLGFSMQWWELRPKQKQCGSRQTGIIYLDLASSTSLIEQEQRSKLQSIALRKSLIVRHYWSTLMWAN